MKLVAVCFTMCMFVALQAQVSTKKMERGWAMLADGIFISQTEVSNEEYRTFLTFTANDPAYAAALWDTAAWSKVLDYNGPFKEHYHSHPAYDSYPAVNMSQQGAALYCQWLTSQYNAKPDRQYTQVIIRLPTAEELTTAIGRSMGWQGAADGSGNMPHAQFQNDKGQYTANFRVTRQDAVKHDGLNPNTPTIDEEPFLQEPALITAPVKSYIADDWGIYNLQGNVAEWTTSAHVTMGGSYATTGWYLLPGRELMRDADKGHPDTGFRYVVEVVRQQP